MGSALSAAVSARGRQRGAGRGERARGCGEAAPAAAPPQRWIHASRGAIARGGAGSATRQPRFSRPVRVFLFVFPLKSKAPPYERVPPALAPREASRSLAPQPAGGLGLQGPPRACSVPAAAKTSGFAPKNGALAPKK